MQNRELAEARSAVQSPVASVSFKGLCEVCAHGSECTYLRNPDVPVLQCGEFEGYGPRPETTQKKFAEQSDRQMAQPSEAEPANLKGLCINCDRRHTCTYPKPETGVWRCEEYE